MSFRIAVVSPFLDKRHGTERCVVEQVERLARHYGYEVHIYSQRVEDLSGVEEDSRGLRVAQASGSQVTESIEASPRGRLIWHRVPGIPGPHLIRYLWWFGANHLWRWRDRWLRGLRCQLTYTPGVNCLDADVISVHMVFAEYCHQAQDELRFQANPLRSWPLLIHRRLHYRMIVALERLVYSGKRPMLAAVSSKTAGDLARYCGPRTQPVLMYHGLDLSRFNPDTRGRLRVQSRRGLGLAEGQLSILLVGNDWRKKGLGCLLAALGRLQEPPHLLVVGQDDPTPYRDRISRYGLGGRVHFLPIRADVESYYAAADVCVGPSLEDAFGLPPWEAMACGLPVIVSRQAGVSEVVTHGVDGLILDDPRDVGALVGLIARLRDDPALRGRLGEAAAKSVRGYTWDRNTHQLTDLFAKAATLKQGDDQFTER
jgi:glycosyltransferase involved in cell wall biosynthesis